MNPSKNQSKDRQVFDQESAGIDNFRIQGKIITYFGMNRWTQLLGRPSISIKNSFTIKIMQTNYSEICVGLID